MDVKTSHGKVEVGLVACEKGTGSQVREGAGDWERTGALALEALGGHRGDRWLG